MKTSKVMTAQEAVSRFVADGMTVAVGGFVHAISYALTHEIIRQQKRHLTICQPSFNEPGDQMIGAGCVDRIISSYVGMETFGPTHCFKRAIEKSIPHKVEIEDYTNFSVMVKYLAGALGIPYIPINSMKGSDLMNYSAWMGKNKVKLVQDPFQLGKEYAAVKALTPDIGYFHVQRADEHGNCQMWGITGDSPWSMRACKQVIVSCEEIVDHDVIGRDPNRTILHGYKVVAVVEAPFGAHPKHTQGYYNLDRDFIFKYVHESQDLEEWRKFMDEWVYGVSDRSDYLKKYINVYGMNKFLGLKAKDISSSSVNYGF